MSLSILCPGTQHGLNGPLLTGHWYCRRRAAYYGATGEDQVEEIRVEKASYRRTEPVAHHPFLIGDFVDLATASHRSSHTPKYDSG
jgi:hypothetical protein